MPKPYAGFKRNNWYVVDQESDMIHRRKDVTKRWDGLIVAKKNNEKRHPQTLPRHARTVDVLDIINTDVAASVAVPTSAQDPAVTPQLTLNPLIPFYEGPASHLFAPGISNMIIGCSTAFFRFRIM